MKNTARLLLVVLLALCTVPLLAQDAAAPIRRSPAPEESPTPSPTATAAPTAAPTPAAEPDEPQPQPQRAEPAERPAEEAAPPRAEPADKSAPAAESQPAATPGRRVINEKPVRAADPRPDWTPRPQQEQSAARAEATPRQRVREQQPARERERQRQPRAARSTPRRPTFDLNSIAGGSPAGDVRALERRWQQALIDRDINMIRELVADDFVGTSSTGRTGTKATLLSEFRRDQNKYDTATVRGMSVRRPNEDVAIVTGIATESGTTPDGKKFRSSRRFTDTWVNRNGRWRCVASHTTAL